MTLFTISFVLFLIMDPFGNIKPFLSMMQEVSPKRRRWVLFREMSIALAVMLFFNFLGEVIFTTLHISESAAKISAGLILFLVAIRIIFPNFQGAKDKISKEEPFIVPLAIPLIAGPSLLATIMIYAHIEQTELTMLAAILIAWAASIAVLFFSEFLSKVLKANGLMACEKLVGLVLVLISIQRFLDGLAHFIGTFQHA